MKMHYGKNKPVKTNTKTEKSTGNSPDSLYTYGNKGNLVGTRLPGHGKPRGHKSKSRGKRRMSY